MNRREEESEMKREKDTAQSKIKKTKEEIKKISGRRSRFRTPTDT